jgi:hypothetical protein
VDDNGVNGANAADPQCAAIANDFDQDGVVNTSDNCPSTAGAGRGVNANPAQLNTDNTGTWAGDGDASGDACDADDDGDNASDATEMGHGTDPKSSSGASPFDLNADANADILDVLLYKPKLAGAYDYKYDLNLDGGVDILDVLLYKPALGLAGVDKYVSDVQFDNCVGVPTRVQNGPQEYTVHLPVGVNTECRVRSVENNRAPTPASSGNDVPAGKAVVSFYCDVQAAPPATNHIQTLCLWVKGAAPLEILTTLDRFANFRLPFPIAQATPPGGTYKPWLSAKMPQVWGPLDDTPLVKNPGDGINWIAESSLHFISTDAEPVSTVVNIDRLVHLECDAAGNYTATLCNKSLPRPPFTEYNPWDNEMCATVHVICP